jgi:hypothetical protein
MSILSFLFYLIETSIKNHQFTFVPLNKNTIQQK